MATQTTLWAQALAGGLALIGLATAFVALTRAGDSDDRDAPETVEGFFARINRESPVDHADLQDVGTSDDPTPAADEDDEVPMPSAAESPGPAAVAEAVDAWMQRMPGAGAGHPLRDTLLGIGVGIGLRRLTDLLEDLTAVDAITGLVRVLERLAERTDSPVEALDARRAIVDLLSTMEADPEVRKLWGVGDPSYLAPMRARSITALVNDALRVGTTEALGVVLLTLGLDDAHAIPVLQRLEQVVRAEDAITHAETLKAIATGTLSLEALSVLATEAMTDGHLELFVTATLAAVQESHEPPVKKAARLIALADLLRAMRDGGAPLAERGDTPAVDSDTLTTMASECADVHALVVTQIGVGLLQRRAATLLAELPARIEALLRSGLDEALRQALEDAGRARAVLVDRSSPDAEGTRQAVVDRVRDLARIRAAVLTVTLDATGRSEMLERLLVSAEGEVHEVERALEGRDEWPTVARERTLGRLNGLRAAKDAIEDLLLDEEPGAARLALDRIFDRLNGAWHDPNLGRANHANFREGGVRERLDAARQAGHDAAVRRLEDELDYLEQRRVQVVARTAPSEADAVGQIQEIKRREFLYWSSRLRGRDLADIGWLFGGDVPAERILPGVQEYRSHLMPVALGAIVRSLEEQGDTPEQVAQGFIRALAQLRAEDVTEGARAWAQYISTPWYRRGWIVGNYRLLMSADIGREMLEDRRFAEALTLAGRTPVDVLKCASPGAYARLIRRGFIRDERYTVPLSFLYTPETVGSTRGRSHWLDGLNAAQCGEIVGTIIVPGGAAARVTRGITASVDAGRAARAGMLGLRLFSEAAAFTALSHGARTVLLGSGTDGQPLAKDFLTNVAVLNGLRLFNRLTQPLERALLGTMALRQGLREPASRVASASTDAAIARAIERAAGKPLSQLTRPELSALAVKLGIETVKIGSEGAAFTALSTLPVIGHGGRFDWESFQANVLFVGQIRGLRVGGSYAVRRAAAVTGQPTSRANVPDAGVIAEPGEASGPRAPADRFRDWYRTIGQQLPIADPARLLAVVQREFQRIADDPASSLERREAARATALVLGGRVAVEFTLGAQGRRGEYDAHAHHAIVNVDEILVGLYNRTVSTLGRQPTLSQVMESLMGTTAHEALEHGLQGLDVPAHPVGGGDVGGPMPNAPRVYTKLHEARAYWTQQLFDPTLGGKSPHYRKGRPVTVDDVFKTVVRSYGDVQGVNLKALTTLNPARLPHWTRAKRRIQARLDAVVREIRRRGLAPAAERKAIEDAVAHARAARAEAMSTIFRTGSGAAVARHVARLRHIRRASSKADPGADWPTRRPDGAPRQSTAPVEPDLPRGSGGRIEEPAEQSGGVLGRELHRLRAREAESAVPTVSRFRRAHVDEVMTVLNRLFAAARANGVADEECAGILAWLRGARAPLDETFISQVDDMLRVSRANAQGLTIVIDAGDAIVASFGAFCGGVRPANVRQINLAALTQVKAKASLEAQTPPKWQPWNAQELAIAREVDSAGPGAIRWWELLLELDEWHGLEQIFTPADLVNIGAVVRRHASPPDRRAPR